MCQNCLPEEYLLPFLQQAMGPRILQTDIRSRSIENAIFLEKRIHPIESMRISTTAYEIAAGPWGNQKKNLNPGTCDVRTVHCCKRTKLKIVAAER